MGKFTRPHLVELEARLREEPRFIINIAGPRQCGKTTLVRQALQRVDRSSLYLAADEPPSPFGEGPSRIGLVPNRANAMPSEPIDVTWLVRNWENARKKALDSDKGFILVLDEIHHVQGDWSKAVKGLWDKDRHEELPLHVVLLGSAPWLMQRGLSESLMGRFETIQLPHWSFPEMANAFGFTLDQFIFFGGYPGSAPLVHAEDRWKSYILNSLIEAVLEKDALALRKVQKPALLRQLLEFGCECSGKILSLDKVLGQLQDAGNRATLKQYMDLLSQVGLIRSLQSYRRSTVAQQRSSPKFAVLNTALMSASSELTFDQAKADPAKWGWYVESAVGAHLCNTATKLVQVYYWRNRQGMEVDFVVRFGHSLAAVEVKSGSRRRSTSGLDAFKEKHVEAQTLVVGTGGIPLEEFLSTTAQDLFKEK